ncbi:MAG: transglutaminase-like domain-containing protein [Candidatus Marinimicrobia bacterium]|nr:transglutaminase-like domain-containing protein [Candidatus Neomarinimicrobiota bacterium]
MNKLLKLLILINFSTLLIISAKHCSSSINQNKEHGDIIPQISAAYRQDVKDALLKAGTNAQEILDFIRKCQPHHQESAAFLVANMPARDLKNLTSKFLLDNLNWAYKAFNQSPWKNEISKELFLNYILPYANVNERRDNWREDFYTKFRPLVKNIQQPGSAAVKLNQKIWDIINVHYTTERPKPDQSPFESIQAQGASCTGLSIILIDACRAVGIPARFVGIPEWVYVRGNHSWVEVWDQEWHYLGAGEPGPLNQTWFTDRAKHARAQDSLHSIYTVSFKKTDSIFPCAWDPNINYVHASNITARYSGKKSESDEVSLSIRVFSQGKRIAVPIRLLYNNKTLGKGNSPDTTNDLNDRLNFIVLPNKTYQLQIRCEKETITKTIKVGSNQFQNYDIKL